uniref:SCP domain-containing protein n=1 Tax=Haemonchus contortus TaxID=6289 RepID=A0A7I4XT75_HAECO
GSSYSTMFLLTLVLLLHLLAEGSSQIIPIANKEQSEYIVNLINEMRAKVANGDISTSYGPLPSSLHMFQLEYSPELEVYAKINTLQCQNENFTPSGSSMNYYTIYETPSDNLNNITVINLALASWMEEILNTNFGSQVTYTNQNMQDFANMMYYKSTKAGCAYQECNQPAPPRAVVACIFNSATSQISADNISECITRWSIGRSGLSLSVGKVDLLEIRFYKTVQARVTAISTSCIANLPEETSNSME